MDDTPQGGAGGVPHRPDDEPEHHGEHETRPGGTVKTVRAGTPVAEQRAEPAHDEPADREEPDGD
ncbi:hypothetical protein RMN57_02025 [Kitasatospora sp. CM 4170]|uniref:Uncharacterized protein n=1 Tax=Kitasatospora aburaviensis TaxID=67265 RepID=A0ABW1EZL3_9ACTN|nr:hypothetical protein [Kitasatospora sp. CM 4170]WNM43560.1 hypothetical protein RMN57_02025 [Kitasatospora sp. CM 4170]